MSTIMDALEKKKREGGEKEVDGLVPVSLDEPQVEVPKEKHTRRILLSVAIVLLIAGGAVSAFFLARDLFGGRSAGDQQGEPSRRASLPQPKGPDISSDRETAEPLPLPGTTPIEEPSLAETAPESPGTTPSPEPSPAEGPSVPKAEPPTPEATLPTTTAVAAPGPQGPVPTTPSGPAPEVATPAPKPDSVTPEPVVAAPADPFAGIKLQGIIRFDPAAPEALINGKTLKVGESFNGIKVVEIGEDSVKLRCGTIEKTLQY